mmetsp:Transcript_36082/g.30379  ORF Transcript_36082/g.30379 Transcript_36082/m.30379 type:complete len:104 (-) Transcript_36082:70-381(-)
MAEKSKNISEQVLKYKQSHRVINKIETNSKSSIMLTKIGIVFTWGVPSNISGRDLDNKDALKLQKIFFKFENKEWAIKDIVVGTDHALAIDFNQKVWAYGDNT